MTIWGYARVSTDDQSCRLQTDALRAAGVTDQHMVEETASGAKEKPRLNALLDQLVQGDALVVWKVDRLGRDAVEALSNADRLQTLGVRLVITTLGVDTGTPAGRLVYGVLAQIAEFERQQIVERTVAGLKSAKGRGVVLGRRPTLDAVQAREARRLVKIEKWSYGRAARMLGVSKSVLWRAVNRVDEVPA